MDGYHRCPAGHPVTSEQAFCGQCGQAIKPTAAPGGPDTAASPATSHGWRRPVVFGPVVLVLALLAGWTAFAASRDNDGSATSAGSGERPTGCGPPKQALLGLPGTEVICQQASPVITSARTMALVRSTCRQQPWAQSDALAPAPLPFHPGAVSAIESGPAPTTGEDAGELETVELTPGGASTPDAPPRGPLGYALLRHYLKAPANQPDKYLDISCTDGQGFHSFSRSTYQTAPLAVPSPSPSPSPSEPTAATTREPAVHPTRNPTPPTATSDGSRGQVIDFQSCEDVMEGEIERLVDNHFEDEQAGRQFHGAAIFGPAAVPAEQRAYARFLTLLHTSGGTANNDTHRRQVATNNRDELVGYACEAFGVGD